MSQRRRKPRNPELFDVEAGRRMAHMFERARVDLGLENDAVLWRYLDVSRDTAQSWTRGERPPSRAVGARVADRLGISYADLLAIYEGRTPDMDAGTVIQAIEWVLKALRSGQLPGQPLAAREPAEVRQQVEQASRQSEARRRTRPRDASSTAHQKEGPNGRTTP